MDGQKDSSISKFLLIPIVVFIISLAAFLGLIFYDYLGIDIAQIPFVEKVVEYINKDSKYIEGKVLEVSPISQLIRLRVKKKEVNILTGVETKYLDQNLTPLEMSDILVGFSVKAEVNRQPDGILTASSVTITKLPEIILNLPLENTKVNRSFQIQGYTRVPDDSLSVRIKHQKSGSYIFEKQFFTPARNMGGLNKYFNFDIAVSLSPQSFNINEGDKLIIEAFRTNLKDEPNYDPTVISVIYNPS